MGSQSIRTDSEGMDDCDCPLIKLIWDVFVIRGLGDSE